MVWTGRWQEADQREVEQIAFVGSFDKGKKRQAVREGVWVLVGVVRSAEASQPKGAIRGRKPKLKINKKEKEKDKDNKHQ